MWAVATLVPAVAAGQIVRSPAMNLEYHRAQAAWKSGGSLLEAKARLDRVLEAGPDDVDAYLLRARVQLALKHGADALADVRRAAELDPESVDAQFVLCQAARVTGDTTLAVQALERSAERLEPDPLKHIVLSREAMLLGRYELSESLARVAVALDGTNVEANYQLARALALRGMLDASALILNRGLENGTFTLQAIGADAVFDSTGAAALVAGD